MPAGRKPKPTSLKLLQGTARKGRLNPEEPMPEVAIPEAPPEWSPSSEDRGNPVALKEWERLTPQLEQLGLLTEIDRAALVAYCEAWALSRAAEAQIREEGITIETEKGNVIQHPAVGVANTARKHMRDFITEFGMSPASRAKVTSAGKKRDKNPFADLVG